MTLRSPRDGILGLKSLSWDTNKKVYGYCEEEDMDLKGQDNLYPTTSLRDSDDKNIFASNADWIPDKKSLKS